MKENAITVVGNTSYANTPIVVLIDGTKIQEGTTDQRGDFMLPLAGVSPGSHTLIVNSLDLEDKIAATS